MMRDLAFMELLVVGIVVATSGLAQIVFGIMARRDRAQFLSRALRTNGTVIRLVETSLDDGPAFAPVVRYAVGDQNFEHVSPRFSGPASYEIAQIVPVFCEPNRPSEAIIEDSIHDTGSLGFGILTLLLGIGVLWLASSIPASSTRRRVEGLNPIARDSLRFRPPPNVRAFDDAGVVKDHKVTP